MGICKSKEYPLIKLVLRDKKVITAVSRKLLVYIYAMLKSGELYDDGPDVADTEK